MTEFLTEEEKKDLEAKREQWKPIVESENGPKCDSNMKGILYKVFDNTMRELNEATLTGDIAQYTPVLISMIRRVMPSLCANRLVGIQALSAPTGRIFCQHVWYGKNKNGGTETWLNGTVGEDTALGAAPNPDFTGTMTTERGEQLGVINRKAADPFALSMPEAWPEMSFSVDFVDVSVKTRALRGELSTEVIQDMKAVHGLDAEQELATILQAEVVAEIDREIINRIYREAKKGCINTSTKGIFDFNIDADGRWVMEKIACLYLQIEREATIIAQETRRGRGNFIITSPELAAYLSMANLITDRYNNAGFTSVINPVGPSYYGKLCNRYDVIVDPYMAPVVTNNKPYHQIVVGYHGVSPQDQGIIYCPYVPINFMFATSPSSFHKIIGLKTRYGTVSNPYYVEPNADGSLTTAAKAATNSFYRKFAVCIDGFEAPSTPGVTEETEETGNT